jgi:hypothetical protein
MTRGTTPVDPYPDPPAPTPRRTAQQRGLSKDLVDEIYEKVLGVETGPRTPTGQFMKGSSGNPKGRPKRAEPDQITLPKQLPSESLGAIAMRQGARKIKAHTDQGEVELSFTEAVVTKMVREAVKGNTGHSRTFLQIVSRAEAEETKRKRELFSHWAAVKEQAALIYQQAELTGEEPALSVHPDDIKLSSDGTVEIVGPTTAEDIAAMRHTHSMVGFHIVNIAYQRWVERRFIRIRGRRIQGRLFAELDFLVRQELLPPRLRLTDDEIAERLKRYARFSGRDLHTLLRQRAAAHGQPVPPREMRVPIVVPQVLLELAKSNKLSLQDLLLVWSDAQSKLAQRPQEKPGPERPGGPDADLKM